MTSTAAAAAPPSTSARDALRQLQSQRDAIELQLEALSSQALVGQQLTDSEGFPRADIDVHTIRNARAELARLQTDHKTLMKSIESSLFAVHAEAKAAKLAANPNAQVSAPIVRRPQPSEREVEEQIRASASTAQVSEAKEIPPVEATPIAASAAAPAQPAAAPRPLDPFYRVASVSLDSPAEVAGLRVDDLVLQFGSITRANNSAAAMASVVSSSIGRQIPVTVLRMVDDQPVRKELKLVPQSWSGRGMLGCHLVDA